MNQQNTKKSDNVFVISHRGSLKALPSWLEEREQFNTFKDHHVDKLGQPYVGLQYQEGAVFHKRGIIVIKDDTLKEGTVSIVTKFLETNK